MASVLQTPGPPSGGHDVTRQLSVQGGFSYLWGGNFFEAAFADEDVMFGYLQVAVRY